MQDLTPEQKLRLECLNIAWRHDTSGKGAEHLVQSAKTFEAYITNK